MATTFKAKIIMATTFTAKIIMATTFKAKIITATTFTAKTIIAITFKAKMPRLEANKVVAARPTRRSLPLQSREGSSSPRTKIWKSRAL